MNQNVAKHIHVSLSDLLSLSCPIFKGPLPSAVKVRGGSPYSQYEMLGSDGLGIPPQGSADSWHRTPGSKMGNKSATSSWPPGEWFFFWFFFCFFFVCYLPKQLFFILITKINNLLLMLGTSSMCST